REPRRSLQVASRRADVPVDVVPEVAVAADAGPRRAAVVAPRVAARARRELVQVDERGPALEAGVAVAVEPVAAGLDGARELLEREQVLDGKAPPVDPDRRGTARRVLAQPSAERQPGQD